MTHTALRSAPNNAEEAEGAEEAPKLPSFGRTMPSQSQLGVGHSEARREASKCEFRSFALEIFRAFRNELFLNASEM